MQAAPHTHHPPTPRSLPHTHTPCGLSTACRLHTLHTHEPDIGFTGGSLCPASTTYFVGFKASNTVRQHHQRYEHHVHINPERSGRYGHPNSPPTCATRKAAIQWTVPAKFQVWHGVHWANMQYGHSTKKMFSFKSSDPVETALTLTILRSLGSFVTYVNAHLGCNARSLRELNKMLLAYAETMLPRYPNNPGAVSICIKDRDTMHRKPEACESCLCAKG